MGALIDVGDGTLLAPPPAQPPPAQPPAPPPPVSPTPAATPLPSPGVSLIDVGDGTLLAPPPAQPPPAQPPAPPPPVPPPVTTTTVPGALPPGTIAQPGHPLIGEGDIGEPLTLITPPPASQPGAGPPGGPGDGGESVGGTDDLGASARIANANRPDMSDLAGYDFLDPYALQEFGATNPPLKGMAALSAIVQACSDFGVDPFAALANALNEGAGGGMGDGGLAYGPWQDHLTEFQGRPFYGKGRSNAVVNAWAWTENGIRYSVRQMATATPSARGLRGHPAVYAIVYGYERPLDKAGAYATRAKTYDLIIAKGASWTDYVAPRLAGPQAGGAVSAAPGPGASADDYQPAGVMKQWREFVDVFKIGVPRKRGDVESLAQSLKEVFR